MEAWILNWFIDFGIAERADKLSFAAPEMLALAFLWPLLWLLSLWLKRHSDIQDDLSEQRNGSELNVKHNLIHLMQKSAPAKPVKLGLSYDFFLELCRGLLIILLAITLAKPVEQLPVASKPEAKTVRDIVFVIESSASFLLPDYELNGQQETRMNVVKEVLDQFIAGLEGNRFSLAIYADKAYTMLPMTYDQTLARLTLKRLKPYLAGRTDTAMGEALGLALKQADDTLSPVLQKSKSDSARKKVLVLISDGLSLPSRLELTEAVNYAQLLQVPIYTIGVGASSKEADKRLYSGLLYQPLESESLQRIASQTGGQYYQVGSGQEIKQVLQKINQAEGVPYIPPPSPPQQKDLYFYPLLLSAIAMLFYWFASILLVSSHSNRGKVG